MLSTSEIDFERGFLEIFTEVLKLRVQKIDKAPLFF